jgi:tight adherence protein C
MLMIAVVAVFLSIALLLIGFMPGMAEVRPTLNLGQLGPGVVGGGKPRGKKISFFVLLNFPARILQPLIPADLRKRVAADLAMAGTDMSPEIFMLVKAVIFAALFMTLPRVFPADLGFFAIIVSIAAGYYLPELYLRGKVSSVKADMVRLLPDTVDLLGLCVNAGLDFMMALKWVIEKSRPSVLIRELDNILQEISVGKPRRDALRDMARKYNLQDLSTFTRTLIQADKMGTSVSEALNILSEDMRLARFRRGEAMALKAPLKMLVPLLFCIFPVVFILVGAPIFLDFVMNNPMSKMAR